MECLLNLCHGLLLWVRLRMYSRLRIGWRHVRSLQATSTIYGAVEPGEIRLVQILPSSRVGDIQCQLIAKDVVEAEYVALSYCWGDSNATKWILLNNHPFPVTDNLYDALVAIWQRHDSGQGLFWIDALCINQYDVEERNAEVYRIWEIYSSAQQVFAFVGAGDEHTVTAFDLMEGLARRCQADSTGTCPVNKAESKTKETFSAHHPLSRLLQSHYFTRTWIVQEFTQARELRILCGEFSCDWTHVHHALSHYQESDTHREGTGVQGNVQEETFNAVRSLCNDRSVVQSLRLKNFCLSADSESRSRYLLFIYFNSVLEILAKSNCSIVHDRIYALLGHPVVRRLDPRGSLKPDYRLTSSELILVTLEWCDVLRDQEDQNRNGDKVFAPQLMNFIWKSQVNDDYSDMAIPARALLALVEAHQDWDTTGLPDSIVTHSGRKIDCTGWVLRRLVRPDVLEADAALFNPA